MVKNKINLILIVGLLVLCCMAMGCENDTTAEPKTLIITAFPGATYNGKIVMVTLHPSFEGDTIVAVGGIQVSGSQNTLSISLKTDTSLKYDWDGTGSYYIFLTISSVAGTVEKMFFYTNGITPNSSGSNVPKYNINESTSVIKFTSFYDVTGL